MRESVFIIILIFSLRLFGQDDNFKIFYCDGKILFKNELEGKWIELKPDYVTLKQEDSIRLFHNSTIYLLDHEGFQCNLSKQGDYCISKAIDSLKNHGGPSLFRKYSQFLWDELNKPHQDIEKYANRYLADKGGVPRTSGRPYVIYPLHGSFILDDHIDFKWEDSGANEYTLTFWDSNDNGNKVFSLQVNDTTISISKKQKWIPIDKMFYWSLTENRKAASIFIPIKILDKKSKNEILKDIKAIEEEQYFTEEVRLLLLAAYYEKNNLFKKANNAYIYAIEFNPENQIIRQYYQLFLARMGIL